MTCRFPGWRRFLSCAVAFVVLDHAAASFAADAAPAHEQPSVPRATRVRSEHPVIAAAIAEASRHSVTFRSIVEAIETTSGIVYIRDGACKFRLRACVAGVHSAPPARYVYISVDRNRAVGCELMASLGHELRHALEVLSNPGVIDNDTLAHFYMRAGPTADNDRFETETAIRAGLAVEREIAALTTCRRSVSTRPGRDPRAWLRERWSTE